MQAYREFTNSRYLKGIYGWFEEHESLRWWPKVLFVSWLNQFSENQEIIKQVYNSNYQNNVQADWFLNCLNAFKNLNQELLF